LTVTGAAENAADADLYITDADTRESLTVASLSPGQARFSVALDQLTSVPCSLGVQLGSSRLRVPVINAPAGCADLVNPADLTLLVWRANWDERRGSLRIVGISAVPSEVKVSYPGTGTTLATVPVNDQRGRSLGLWMVHLSGFDASKVPCAIRAEAGAQMTETAVDDAPANCIGGSGTTPPPPVPNQAPKGNIVAPTTNVTIAPGGTVSFSSNGTDPDNNVPLSYQWDFGGGATNSNLQNPGAVTFATAGTYTVKLTVADRLGLADPNPPTRTVTVTASPGPQNQAPKGTIATPTADVTIAPGATVNFTGSGSDPDNNLPLTYAWDFGGGASNATQQNPGAVTFATAGTYTVKFTVTDSNGLADPNPPTRKVTVTANPGPQNQAPKGTILGPPADMAITAGASVTFGGAGTDPDNNVPLTYLWDFGGAATNSTQQNPAPVTFATPGTFTVKFVVTDSLGLADPNPPTRKITVTAAPGPQNQAPTGTIATPAASVTLAPGATVSFTGSGTDPDNNLPLTYAWDFGGGATNSTLQNPGTVTFATAGTYTVKFTVTDSKGLADPNPPTRTVTVTANPGPQNQAPKGTIATPAADVTVAAGATVSFTGSGTDPDNNVPLSFAWDFGGGAASSTQQNPGAVTFATAGTYTVKFTVTDSKGLADPNPPTRKVTVTGGTPGTPPSGSITTPAADTSVAAGATVMFAATGTDPGNSALTYAWNFAGGAPNSTQQNPGAVTFSTPGIYPVTMTVTNAAGTPAATPAKRVITVSAAAPKQVVVGGDREGMTFPDGDYSVLSVLPLGNSLQVQVVNGNQDPQSLPTRMTDTAVVVGYKGLADPKGSITTTSAPKTNFWPLASAQYSFMLPAGVTLAPDQGLQGATNKVSQSMPGTANTLQPFGQFDMTSGINLFKAPFIPMVPKNDANAVNNYPLLRVDANDKTSQAHLAHLDITVAVANQMDCATACHATGGIAADAAEIARLPIPVTWSTNTDVTNQAKENIWIMHEALFGTPAGTTTNDTCTRCHYTPMADPDGVGPAGRQIGRPPLSLALHKSHGLAFNAAAPTATAPAIIADDKCATCHESGGVKYSRGAMFSAGQTCSDCHGGMLAVGGQIQLSTSPARTRVPYVDQPRCESCHIGDALSVTTGPLILTQAYEATDPAATARTMPASRYAQETGKTYADSLGHGSISCIGCHGSSHAEWPVDDPASNDNEAPMHLQGHRGVLTECKVCHSGGLDVTLMGGPHGLHAVNDPGWVAQHGPVYTADPQPCIACHGATLDGSHLGEVAADRSFVAKDGTTKTYSEGDMIKCDDCHAKPK
jgi:PKD repeat protein